MDSDALYDATGQAVRKAGLTVLNEAYYKFSPYGATFFFLLSESHASFHTWPEHGYCAVDLFTCNLSLDLTALVDELKDILGAASCSLRVIDRTAQI